MTKATKPLIEQAFRGFGECFISPHIGDAGFVVYQQQAQAQAAFNALSNQITNGFLLQIEWSDIDDPAALANAFTPFEVNEGKKDAGFQDESESMRMNIEEEIKGGDEVQPSLSIRNRVYYAVQNGLKEDTGPKDIHFSLLYFKMQLDTIINNEVLEYCKNQLLQVPPVMRKNQDFLQQTLSDLYQRIKQLEPFKQLLSSVIDNYKGSDDEKEVLRFAAMQDLKTTLQYGFGPLLQKRILNLP